VGLVALLQLGIVSIRRSLAKCEETTKKPWVVSIKNGEAACATSPVCVRAQKGARIIFLSEAT